MPGPFYNNIKGTTAGAAGTGAFTPNAAATGALAWSTVPAGKTGLVLYEDGAAWELQYSYWNGTTLSRNSTAGSLNQFVNSSTGSTLSLSSAATASLVVDGSEVAPHLSVPWCGAAAIVNQTSTNVWGVAGATNTGTAAAAALAATNYLTEQPRTQLTSATTANAQAGQTFTSLQPVAVVNTTAGRGGFEAVFRFGVSQLPTGPRAFIGMTSATFVANAAEPSAFTANYAVVGLDSTDTNLQFLVNSNAGGGTKIDTGIPLAVNGFYEATIWCDPGSNTMKLLLIRLDTGAIAYISTSTDTPANGALLSAQALIGLSGTTGTAAVMHMGCIYVRPGAG